MKKIKIIAAAFIATTLAFQISAKSSSKGKILLSWESTKFKDALITELETLLRNDGFEIVKVVHSKDGLAPYNASDFKAVFISNSGVNSKVRPWVVSWIEKNKSSGTYILLHTTQTRDWKVVTSVDAVTSASVVPESKAKAMEYRNQIISALKKGSK
jgi:hypothetical protein